MKTKSMFAMIALGIVSVASSAMARSPMPVVWDAQLKMFDVDPKLNLPWEVGSGAVKVDYWKNVVALRLSAVVRCSPEGLCPHLRMRPYIVELPIVSVETNECGVRQIVAREDLRRVDGAFHMIALRDNRANHCPTFAPVAPTQVLYETESYGRQGRVDTHSTFSGESLRPFFPLQNDAGTETRSESGFEAE